MLRTLSAVNTELRRICIKKKNRRCRCKKKKDLVDIGPKACSAFNTSCLLYSRDSHYGHID